MTLYLPPDACAFRQWNAAETAQFDVFVTTDKNIRYQQNLTTRKIAIVVLGNGRWRLIKEKRSAITAAVDGATQGSYIEIEIAAD